MSFPYRTAVGPLPLWLGRPDFFSFSTCYFSVVPNIIVLTPHQPQWSYSGHNLHPYLASLNAFARENHEKPKSHKKAWGTSAPPNGKVVLGQRGCESS